MKTIEEIRLDLQAGTFKLTDHALKRMVERNISAQEIKEAGTNAFVIEDYPSDKYSPSCLILGFTANGRSLHLQVTCQPGTLKIITLYEPNENKWTNNYSQRR
jgi:hypothetical protein